MSLEPELVKQPEEVSISVGALSSSWMMLSRELNKVTGTGSGIPHMVWDGDGK